MARGALGRPLKPQIPETVYEDSIEFDDAIELLEPLLFLVARLLNELCARLKSQSLAAGELHLALNRIGRVLRLPFPTRDTKFLLKLLHHNLETEPPGDPESPGAVRVAVNRANVALPRASFVALAPGCEKLGWFRRLKASARTCQASRSVNFVFLTREKSRFAKPGPVTTLRPKFPKKLPAAPVQLWLPGTPQ
jgi:hypothetical protein